MHTEALERHDIDWQAVYGIKYEPANTKNRGKAKAWIFADGAAAKQGQTAHEFTRFQDATWAEEAWEKHTGKGKKLTRFCFVAIDTGKLSGRKPAPDAGIFLMFSLPSGNTALMPVEKETLELLECEGITPKELQAD
jgi:hypothetical protein